LRSVFYLFFGEEVFLFLFPPLHQGLTFRRTKDDDAARKGGNKGGAFEGFKESHTETEAQQSLVYHDDL
jgi:hypothetical protein